MNINNKGSFSCCVNYKELRHLLNIVDTVHNMTVIFNYGNWNIFFTFPTHTSYDKLISVKRHVQQHIFRMLVHYMYYRAYGTPYSKRSILLTEILPR